MTKKKIKAYSIFEGGGVKGIALAGAYEIASGEHVEILGHAGASAGSIIALLANIGLTGVDIKDIIKENHSGMFNEGLKFLLSAWKSGSLFKILVAAPYALWMLKRHKGICSGKEISNLLNKISKEKLSLDSGFTFSQLYGATGKPLKVITTDLVGKKPIFYSHKDTPDACVVSAVIASCSYPLVFKPSSLVLGKDQTIQVDGGISSNLPSFLFDEEARREKCSIFCFDLITAEKSNKSPTSGFFNYIFSIINAAIEADSHITKRIVSNIHTIPIEVPCEVNTFTIDIDHADVDSMYNLGYTSANEYFRRLKAEQDVSPKEKAELITRNLAPLDSFQSIAKQLRNSLIDAMPELGKGDGFEIWIYVPTLYATFVSIASTEQDNWKEIRDGTSATWRCWEGNDITHVISRESILKQLAMPISLRGRKAGVILFKFKNGTSADLIFSNIQEKMPHHGFNSIVMSHVIIYFLMLTNPTEDYPAASIAIS